MTRAQAAVYIDPADGVDIDEVCARLQKVFGVLSITRACVVEKDIEAIKKRRWNTARKTRARRRLV